MAEQCIVCLTDLGLSTDALAAISVAESGWDDSVAALKSPSSSNVDLDRPLRLIACLIPCKHHLHNDCLAPWVERANSCPICRTSFNHVELYDKIGGSLTSSYEVANRVQAPDVDPSEFPAALEDEEFESEYDEDLLQCRQCHGVGDQAELRVCSSCEHSYHTYCLDTPDTVVCEDWLCDICSLSEINVLPRPPADPTVDTNRRGRPPYASPENRSRRFGQGQRRPRIRDRNSAWAEAWQVVWDRLSVELDHPETVDVSSTSHPRSLQRYARHQREFRAWQRRFEVAQRQGGSASRFRESKPALLPTPETREEQQAWKDLEVARDLDRRTATGGRKRKSPSGSPNEPRAEDEAGRKFKRPMTRRARELGPSGDQKPASTTGSRRSPRLGLARGAIGTTDGNRRAPSFLRSLLTEVEIASPAEVNGAPQGTLTATSISADGHGSRQASSSPASSPRPPPNTGLSPQSSRPGSPLLLRSTVEPVYPAPSTSPTRAPNASNTHSVPRRGTGSGEERRSSVSTARSKDGRSMSPRPRGSASKRDMSPSAKTDISRLVKLALRPFHKNGSVSYDDYTSINRNVSRKLYDLVGATDHLDSAAKERWEKVAVAEVGQAVQALKISSKD
ncbi:MAG: PHD and RING finger domain-containing protein 1 [Lichina confinis]|nr:MAG: PHD and RING finger domain-containing protein 1 [Lichina confinis]